MRKRLIVLAATAVMTLAVPGTAMAGPGYGKTINDGCGASYGQLVSTAKSIGHVSGSVGGARNWVESGLAAAHGCNV